LRLWSDDFAPFGGENARRGGIHLREKLPLHATKEQANTPPFCANGRSDFRDGFLGSEPRKQRFHRLPFLRNEVKNAQAANDGLQARFLIGEEWRAQAAQTIRTGKRFEEKTAMALFGS